MNHKELKVVAKELNITDVDSLSYNELKSKVSQAKKAKQKTIEKVAIATTLVGSPQANSANEEVPNLDEIEIHEDQVVGVPLGDSLPDLDNRDATEGGAPDPTDEETPNNSGVPLGDSLPDDIDGPADVEDMCANHTKVSLFVDQTGRKYGFTADAPDKFRFNNLVKTKEDWIQDQDAMEQLALGNCSFVEQIFD